MKVLGILPDTRPNQEEESRVLRQLGITPRFVPVPVPLSHVSNSVAGMELGLVLSEMELRYYGVALMEFDRVVIVDGDAMLLQPIDELFGNFDWVSLKATFRVYGARILSWSVQRPGVPITDGLARGLLLNPGSWLDAQLPCRVSYTVCGWVFSGQLASFLLLFLNVRQRKKIAIVFLFGQIT